MNNPELYAIANDLTRRDIRKLSEEFADEFGKITGLCLDVGSGPGDVVIDFILPKLNSKASLVCSDISDEMVKFGKEKYKDNQRLSFIELDIESRLPDHLIEQFDHVTSSYCLHWCRDIHLAFDNIFNLLRPGGTALVSFISDTPIFDAYEVLGSMPQYMPYMKDVDRYIPIFHHGKQKCKNLMNLLDTSGFEIHHCSYRQKMHTFDITDGLSNLVLSVSPFAEHMPDALKEEYGRDMVRNIVRDQNAFNENSDEKRDYDLIYHTLVVFVIKPKT